MITTSTQAGNARIAPGVAEPAELAGLTLRGKGVVAVAALFLYLVVATLVVGQQRSVLAGAVEEVERAHGEEDGMARVNMSLAQAIIATNERYYRPDPSRDFTDVALGAEAVHTGIAGLAPRFPYLAPVGADIAQRIVEVSASRDREALLDLRQSLHRAVSAMDQATLDVRSRRQALNALYRTRYDQVSMTSIGLSVVGMLVFGAFLLLFLARLGWDLKRLQERSLAVVKGYRGPALAVTRLDEIGALMRSVNRMQQELLEHEARTEIARREQFHREKMAAVGALAAQVAHEINNPIAAITGVAEAICELRRSAPCAAHGAVCQPELIVQQARRVAAITRQISEFASPQPAEAQLLDLNGLVESACAFARYDARLGKLQLELALDRQLPAVHAVGDHLTQVLMNLLMNAADAIAEAGIAGRIRIATQRLGNAVLLTVSDNGAGMEERTRLRAFEDFFTTKPKGKGCGVGLALSRRLLREAGADIELESRPGAGTVAAVRLPLAA
jgi:two-component system NtrC family sensor kinase